MFDLIFIFKYIASLHKKYDISILKRNNKILSIKIINRKLGVSITIKDSYLLLPSSLSKLAINFDTLIQKGLEPVLTKEVTGRVDKLFYIQKDISHYSKEVLELDNFLDWETLIVKYCNNDCISLYQILIKFRKLIFDNFNILIDKYPTTPSLAFAIFRSKYLAANTIPIVNGEVDTFLRKSFTGGSTDSIIPYGKMVYCYDVNSLYPTSMANQLFCSGILEKFIDISNVPLGNLWIALVKVTTKKDLHIPYLQIHHNNRTLSPNGSFEMYITSSEYYNSLNDYNFEIIEGYHFKGKIYLKIM